MTLTIELTPEQEACLTRQAQERNQEITEYARQLFEKALQWESDAAWEADLQALSEGCERLPVLSPDAFSRESLYGPRG